MTETSPEHPGHRKARSSDLAKNESIYVPHEVLTRQMTMARPGPRELTRLQTLVALVISTLCLLVGTYFLSGAFMDVIARVNDGQSGFATKSSDICELDPSSLRESGGKGLCQSREDLLCSIGNYSYDATPPCDYERLSKDDAGATMLKFADVIFIGDANLYDIFDILDHWLLEGLTYSPSWSSACQCNDGKLNAECARELLYPHNGIEETAYHRDQCWLLPGHANETCRKLHLVYKNPSLTRGIGSSRTFIPASRDPDLLARQLTDRLQAIESRQRGPASQWRPIAIIYSQSTSASLSPGIVSANMATVRQTVAEQLGPLRTPRLWITPNAVGKLVPAKLGVSEIAKSIQNLRLQQNDAIRQFGKDVAKAAELERFERMDMFGLTSGSTFGLPDEDMTRFTLEVTIRQMMMMLMWLNMIQAGAIQAEAIQAEAREEIGS